MSSLLPEQDAFLGSKVAYEIYIRSFSNGDLRRIAEWLDYL